MMVGYREPQQGRQAKVGNEVGTVYPSREICLRRWLPAAASGSPRATAHSALSLGPALRFRFQASGRYVIPFTHLDRNRAVNLEAIPWIEASVPNLLKWDPSCPRLSMSMCVSMHRACMRAIGATEKLV